MPPHGRSTYSLLQTPEFVEEFILDRTFEPSVREFGLAHTSVIDPTCGSGHFLLGAFGRLLRSTVTYLRTICGLFAKPFHWRNRGKLDVPKERFVSYPRSGRDGDPTELLGWAGWNHLAQARVLAAVYLDRKTQAGWAADRLLRLLAGLVELEQWLHQWHGDPQPGFVGSPADFFTA